MYFHFLTLHNSLTMAIIGLGAINMLIGLRKLRNSTEVEAMVGEVSLHRRFGHMMQWIFGGTLMCAYVVYAMSFHRFPSA